MTSETEKTPHSRLHNFVSLETNDGVKIWLDKSAAPGSWDFFLKAHAIVPLILGLFVFAMAITQPSSASNSGKALLVLLGVILTAFGLFAVLAWWIVETGKAGRFLLITGDELYVQYGLIFDNEENRKRYSLSQIKAIHVKEVNQNNQAKPNLKPTYGLILELENEFKAIWQFSKQEEAEEIKTYLEKRLHL